METTNIIAPITFIQAPVQNTNYEILHLDNINSKREKYTKYNNGNLPVPRVSEILKDTIGKDFLLQWALRLGLEAYNKESAYTLYTGTIVHEMIERFLLKGIMYPDDINYRNYTIKKKSITAFDNFLNWYKNMINKGYQLIILAIEREITTPWYGGTIDCIMRVIHKEYNIDTVYIVDFKTSKRISVEYLLQTYSYLWAINYNRSINPNFDIPEARGVGIIRVDKEYPKYEDIFLSYDNPEQAIILEQLKYSFSSMINWYYNLFNMRENLKISKQYNFSKR